VDGVTCHVLMPVFDGIKPLDAIGPHEVFTAASALVTGRGGGTPGYRVTTPRHGPVRARGSAPGVHTVPGEQVSPDHYSTPSSRDWYGRYSHF
jgi:hypothetical protein